MGPKNVPLFEVVPWSHGYAHSWALRWLLLNNQQARDRLLKLFLPAGAAPWTIQGMKREYPVNRNRADLRFEALDAGGSCTEVLVETKVNDAVRDPQIEAYCDTSAAVILYGPGLTGLLHAGAQPIAHERWVSGRQVTEALQGLPELPDLIVSYLTAVTAQANRMESALRAVAGGPDFDRRDDLSEVSANEVEAVAWLAVIAAEMRGRGHTDIRPRNTAHDYGLFWAGSWTEVPNTNDLGLFIDIVATHGGTEYAITIKVGGGDAESRQQLYDAAVNHSPGPEWVKGRRRSSDTFRVWKRDAINLSAPEAAAVALEAERHLQTVI